MAKLTVAMSIKSILFAWLFITWAILCLNASVNSKIVKSFNPFCQRMAISQSLCSFATRLIVVVGVVIVGFLKFDVSGFVNLKLRYSYQSILLAQAAGLSATNALMLQFPTLIHSAITIIKPHNIIFAHIIAALHFNNR